MTVSRFVIPESKASPRWPFHFGQDGVVELLSRQEDSLKT